MNVEIKTILYLLLVIPFCFNDSYAVDRNSWRHWSVESGLKSNYSDNIVVKPDGSVLITHGDHHEISHFDGYRFRSIPAAKLASPFIFSVTESDSIWRVIPTGVSHYNGTEWIDYSFQDFDPSESYIHAFNDETVVVLYQYNLYFYQPGQENAQVLYTEETSGIGGLEKLFSQGNDTVWFLGQTGISRLTQNQSQFKWDTFIPDSSLQIESLLSFVSVPDNAIFITAQQTDKPERILLRFDGNAFSVEQYLTEDISIAFKQHHHFYWYLAEAFYAPILGVLSHNNYFTDIGIESGYINHVEIQKDNAFWVASSNGIYRYSPTLWQIPDYFITENHFVHSIIEDSQNQLWIAATNKIITLHGDEWKIYPIDNERYYTRYNSINALNLWQNNKIILETQKRNTFLVELDADNSSELPFQEIDHPRQERIRTTVTLRNGDIIVQIGDHIEWRFDLYSNGTFQSLFEIEPDQQCGYLKSIYESSDGSIWFCGTQGMGRYKDDIFQKVIPNQTYIDFDAFCMLEVEPNLYWIGSRNGIFEMSDESMRLIRTGIGTPRCIIKSHDNSIWVASGNGIHRYYNNLWTTFTNEEGLPSNAAYVVFEDSQHRIWAGTSNGLSLYHPEADQDPPITILQEEETHEPIPYGDHHTFHFQGIDKWNKTQPDRLYFSHRVNGGEWSEFRNESNVTIDLLPADTYRLDVRTMDRNMNISVEPAHFSFTVLPPWYLESYTVSLIVILALLVILFIAVLYIQNHRLEKTVKQRTTQLQTTNKILQLESNGLRQVQRELQSLNNNLEGRVEERTKSLIELNRELQYEILKRAEMEKEKRILEESYYHAQRMESLGIFVGGIAHDFNNLLMGVILYSELLLMDEKHDEETVSHLKHIMDSGKRASQMVKQLLTFSRKEKSAPVLVDINELIQLFQKTFSRLIGEDISLSISLDESIQTIKMDPVQLEQVITNIVINARDAMPNGGSIHIQTEMVEYNEQITRLDGDAEETQYVKLSIQDTGMGMDEATKSKIFDPFFTTKDPGKGTGLGLSTVYGIIKASQGYVDVDSEEGSGTTFHLYFPVCLTDTDMLAIDEDTTIPRIAHETILVLEDDNMVLSVVRQTLSTQGYTVISTRDVEEAVDIATQKANEIDLLITDVVMPKDNGITIAHQIRDIIPSIQVLFMSGYVKPEYEERIQKEFDGSIILKPFQTNELTLKVQSILQHDTSQTI